MRRKVSKTEVVSCACVLGSAVLHGTVLHAAEPELTSDSAAQLYDVRNPTGQTVISRTRFTTTLGVSVGDLLDQEKTARDAPELSFRARFRYDGDFGVSSGETNEANASRLVPGLSPNMADLMYGYVEGKRFFHGTTGFKVGRQYVTDALGWWSFDGASVKLTSPYHVAVEGYGGLEVRGGMPLSTARWEAGGVWRGSRSGFDPSLYPQFQQADVAPAYGVALEAAGFTWLHSRLTYRRVYNTGSVGIADYASGLDSPGTYSGTRISTDKVGYAVEADLGKRFAVKGGLAYDLYNVKFSSIYASTDFFATRALTVSVDYDYFSPTYDADSIWNFFAGEPMNDISLRGAYDLDSRISFAGGVNTRIYTTETSAPNPYDSSPNLTPGTNPNYYPTNGQSFAEGGNLAARYRTSVTTLAFRGAADSGPEGERVGGDVSGSRLIDNHYVVSSRVGVWQWDDKLRTDHSATNFGYVLGAGYRFSRRTQVMGEWQQDMNRLSGQRLRALLTLTVAVTK